MRLPNFPLLDGSEHDTFTLMKSCDNCAVWQHIMSELNGTIHPGTGDTLLHVAAQTGNLDVVNIVLWAK
jgi:hypothetical protein